MNKPFEAPLAAAAAADADADADAADAAARNADRASAEELTRIRRAASCAGNAKDAQSSSRIGRRLHWRLA